jgi:predicted TIM-barrel fold metal-dependent hydrolase
VPDYPTIDAHVHTYRSRDIGRQAMMGSGHTDYGGTVEELVALMERGGIEQAVMVNMTPVAEMFDAAQAKLPPDLVSDQRAKAEASIRGEMIGRLQRRNTWTCEIPRQHPQLVAFISLDPSMGEDGLVAEIDRCVGEGARGIKLHPSNQFYYPDDRRLWPAYAHIQALGLPIISHSGTVAVAPGGGHYAHPRHFTEVVSAFPKLTVVLAHAGRGAFDTAQEMASTYPNVFFDCCATVNGTEVTPDLSDDEAVSLLRALGCDRVLFGSDYPWFDPILDAQRIGSLPLSSAEKRAILYENAQRTLRL